MVQEVSPSIKEKRMKLNADLMILKLRVLLEKVVLVKYSWLKKSQVVKSLP